uniref:NADH-ubiquinone oxidoreductase chain 4 n=1 Tax=Zorotypus medoensis TaxID=1264643 RepID=A0A0A7C3U2_9NEOP|nr:NADH dehydrogenase subunit 4 [Zorotypus medoensis]AHY35148.1 NADH dehydrogenase subunit 4 [Zorotypus medoensis]
MMSMIVGLMMMIPLAFVKVWFVIHFFLGIMCFVCLAKYYDMDYICMMSSMFGLDIIGVGLILLSFWIIMLMISGSVYLVDISEGNSLYMFMLLVLLISLVLVFMNIDMLIFYIFFEFSMVPTFYLILGWGGQLERFEASMYMLFYTLLASLPMLGCIIIIQNSNCSSSFSMILFYKNYVYTYMYIGLILGFLVKLPMFLVHLWLPSAHVEAPVTGSMILAGIMLKLGGMGLIRFGKIFMMNMYIMNLFIIMGLVGGLLVSMICLFQVDMKLLVAYSSVSHMSLCIGGCLGGSTWGVEGAYGLMIGHGLCSSGLFYLVNLAYERSGSRSLFINSGGMLFYPSLSMLWFLECSSNMSAPLSMNLISEIMIYNSIVVVDLLFIPLLMLLGFLVGCYSLYLFSYSQHGLNYSGLLSFGVVSFKDYLVVFMHWIPLNFLFLVMDVIFY